MLLGYGFAAAAEIDLADTELQRSWGGPMNGQEGRKGLVLELLEAVKPSVLVETGAYRGTTTEWFASNFDGPIYSCDANKRYYLQARSKLAPFTNAKIYFSDSRAFLRNIIPEIQNKGICIFYLDAHWLENLPLVDELNIIHHSKIPAIIIIDDFEVPDDNGYGFDNYGENKKLCLDLISPMPIEFKIFFPSLSSKNETGERRGCCVLSNIGDDVLENLPSLRKL